MKTEAELAALVKLGDAHKKQKRELCGSTIP